MYLDARLAPLCQHSIHGMISEEAQISTTRLHAGCFGLELVPGQVEVNLLASKSERVATFGVLLARQSSLQVDALRKWKRAYRS